MTRRLMQMLDIAPPLEQYERKRLLRDIFSKPDPPQPPDYKGAAIAQGDANLDSAIATGILNRPNQISPYGTQSWTQTGSTPVGGRDVPNYTSNVSFSPTGQKLFDQGLNLQTGLMDIGQGTLDNAKTALGGPFDISKNRDALVDAMYRRSTRMLDPQYKELEDRQRTDLANRGFSVGDEGYNRATESFARQRDSAYGQARDQAMTGGANQAIQEALLQRSQPLQELNAIRTGAMPQNPTFNQQTQAGGVNAAPILAGAQAAGTAANQLYGLESSNYNNTLNGLASLGKAYFMGPTGF